MSMITALCPICTKKKFQFLYSKDGFKIVKCRGCGLILVNPRLNQKEINKRYNKNYYIRPKNPPKGLLGYDNYPKRFISGKEKIKNQLILGKIADFKPRRGRLLDVGAATGFFVRDAQKAGWQAEGVEISAWATKYAREKLKVKVREGELKEQKYWPKTFDVIAMTDFLEHVQNPNQEIEEARRILKPKGILYLETLNFEGFVNTKIIGKNYVHMAPSLHLTYFGRKQLVKLLFKNNFKIRLLEITSSSVGDFEYEGPRMYLQYLKLIFKRLGGQKIKNWAFRDMIKIIAQK